MSILFDKASVNNLMVEGIDQWNQILLTQLYNPLEVKPISHIPCSIYKARDQLVWWFSKDGYFIVHSAYYLALSRAN